MATLWSTTNIAGALSLDSTDLIVSSSGSGSVLSSRVLTSTLTYFEVAVQTFDGGGGAVGVATYGRVGNAGNIPGSDSNSVGYRNDGAVIINNAAVATLAPYTDGAVVGVAIDMQQLLIWFTLDGNTWNNDILANQNPAGSIGGISLASMAWSSPRWATLGFENGGCQATGVFSGFSYDLPTNYSSVDDCNITHAINVQPIAHSNTHVPFTPVSFAKSSLPVQAYKSNPVPPIVPVAFARATLLPDQYTGSFYAPATDPTYIFGITKQNGVAVGGIAVFAYDAESGRFLTSVYSDSVTGEFSLPALGLDKVDLVAKDPAYGAKVFINLIPASPS